MRIYRYTILLLFSLAASSLQAQDKIGTEWWEGLSEDWKKIFIEQAGISEAPSRKDFKAIEKMTAINCSGYDDLGDPRDIRSLKPLELLGNLEKIDCSASQIEDLAPLANMQELKVLNISSTYVESLKPLSALTKLEEIYCAYSFINTLEGLENCENLRKVDVAKAEFDDFSSAPFDLQSLTSFKKLKVLALEATGITSLAPLMSLVELEELRISRNQVYDLTPLTVMLNLKKLEIFQTQVSDLEPLTYLTSLEFLNCSENSNIVDISPVEKLPNLKVIFFSRTGVSSLEPLRKLEKIKELTFSETYVENLTPLTGKSSITTIICTEAPIKSIDPVLTLENLNIFYFRGSMIGNNEIEAFKEQKPNCEIDYF